MAGGGGFGEGERAGLHRRQPGFDEGGAAVMFGGQQRPVALDGAQRIGGGLHRGGGQQHRRGPAFQGPGGVAGQIFREGEPAMPGEIDAAAAEFFCQIRLEPGGGEPCGARCHGRISAGLRILLWIRWSLRRQDVINLSSCCG